MSVTHKKIPYLRRARRTLLSQDMEKKERRKSIYSTCKENYKKRKKVLAIYGKILYSIYLSAVRQTPHDDAGHRKASQCFMDFKKEIQKSCSKIINIKLYLIRYIIKRSERIISSLLLNIILRYLLFI